MSVCVCVCGWLFSDWRSSLLFLVSRGFLFVFFFFKSGLDVGFWQMLFLWLLRLSCVFWSLVDLLCNIVNYID